MTAPPKEQHREFLAVARIARPQGRRGEVAAEILTDFPERFARMEEAYLASPGGARELVRVENAWPHKGRIILKFSGVDSIDEAERLRGIEVLVPFDKRVRLEAHQYYVADLEGCRVLVEREGTVSELGIVSGVDPTGGVDVLRVETSRGEVLIPLAQEICRRIDTESKVIIIDPPEDLLELNEGS